MGHPVKVIDRRRNSSTASRSGYRSSDSEVDSYDEDDIRREEIPEKDHKRVILLLDLDCYEAQVWIKEKRPELENQDVPVVVANLDDIILAVNYTARQLGISRGNGRRYLKEIQNEFPELQVIHTAIRHGKQDSFTPQVKSDDIFQVLLNYQKTLKDKNSIVIERASKDEMYIDVTQLVKQRTKAPRSFQKTFGLRLPDKERICELTTAVKSHPNGKYRGRPKVIMEGRKEAITKDKLNFRILQVYPRKEQAYHADEVRLVHGAVIAYRLAHLIRDKTGFQASVGVAHNKLLAKLACDRNKPEGITILTDISLSRVCKTLKFQDIRGFGGKTGEDLQQELSQRVRKAMTLHDVITVPLETLMDALASIGSADPESDALCLLSKCRGQDDSIVEKRHFSDALNASINFKGFKSVKSWKEFEGRVRNLSDDLGEKIKYSVRRWKREPHSLVAKATMRKRANCIPEGKANKMRIDGSVCEEDIEEFLLAYVEQNGLDWPEIEELKLTASSFSFYHL